ncbi:hypothetical protein GCM10025859_66120 [Alicyclobacillus fastidiosus]|nr:hypothetical protein GCM10025859_63920 [Alicyclobacillus fastidiosus]GMA66170.1 hypothetical protein GCM10025859_66120 [Alicyclobacillus fastidiosus]
MFDILYLNGKDVTNLAMMERKDILHSVVIPGDALFPLPFIVGNGTPLWEQTEAVGWEGIVAKRRPLLCREAS